MENGGRREKRGLRARGREWQEAEEGRGTDGQGEEGIMDGEGSVKPQKSPGVWYYVYVQHFIWMYTVFFRSRRDVNERPGAGLPARTPRFRSLCRSDAHSCMELDED